MDFHKRIFHVLLLFSCIPCLYGNTSSPYTFKWVSVPEGLSQTTVYCICQDSLGYIWIGTQDGLNKYNGHNMVVYESEIQDTTTLSSSFIKSLFVDYKNYIWIGGLAGVSRYSYEQDCFKRYKLPGVGNCSEINNICSDKDAIWVSSQIGELYVRSEKNDSFTPVVYQQKEVNKRVSIQKMKSIGHYLYLCGFNGFYRLNKQNYKLEHLFASELSSEMHDFVFDANDEVWLGTREKGLVHLDSQFRFKEQFMHANHANSIIGDKIRALSVNHLGEILIGTYFGLSVLNPNTGNFQNYTNRFNNSSVLSSNSVLTIFTDKDNGVWIGTSLGGVNYYHKENGKFTHVQCNGEQSTLISNTVNCIVQQKDYIWIGYNENGISRFNVKTNKVEHFLADNQGRPITIYKNIRSILPLPDGSLLLGSLFGGLIHFNPQTKQMKTFSDDNTPYSLKDDRISALYNDSRGNIWVGTYNGLFKFDIQNTRFYPFEELYPTLELSSKEINCMIEDHRKALWIGTVNGLNRCELDEKKIDRFVHVVKDSTSITSNRVSAIYEDTNNQIWVGTSKGLNIFQEATRSFVHLTSKEGLLNDMVLTIMEDNNRNLWVSNNKGLTRVVPKTFYCESFTKEDGLGNQQLIAQSAIKLQSGILMFGGINGITFFDPREVEHSIINKKVLFSDLYIGEHRVRPHDRTKILSTHIAQTKEIELNYNQRDFSISFSAVNFNQQSFTYQYKLEGHNTSWLVTDKNSISFFNLPDGEYTLFVKVVPLNNVNDEQYTALSIIILPPWWRSHWMYLVYLFVCCVTAYLIYLKIQIRIRRKNEKFASIIEAEKLKEFQKMRQQLFINISHELKTPLSLIISPLQELYRQVLIDKRTRIHVDMAYSNSRKLNELINQLIDFSKTEQNDINLMIQKGNVRNVLYKVYLSFLTIADAKEIKYDFSSEEEPEPVFFDAYVMERIVTNLLSNAFKFTPNKGVIRIALTYKAEQCCISVADSGAGISKEEIGHVFDRYYTTLSSSGGTGIGLAFVKHLVALHKGTIAIESEKGKGATFTVNIPVNLPVTNKEASSIQFEKKLVLNEDDPEPNTCIAGNRILIVDDNVDMVRYLQDYYNHTNDVVVAYSGSQAVELLERDSFDIIISDVMMPDIDGFTLCKKVKRNLETSHISFVLLTALCDAEFIIKGIYSGADDYITKPFSLKVLDAKLDHMVMLKKKGTELQGQEVLSDSMYTSLEQDFIQKVTQIVNVHIEDAEYRVQDLAEELCMSPSKLNRKFMAMIGKSPVEFIRKIRLRRAVTLLDSQKYSVSEVCYMVGFTTPTYFSVCFKKEFGCSPSNYVPIKASVPKV